MEQLVIDFLFLSLATWRVSSLLVIEAGPWDWFAKLRHTVGVRYDEYSVPYGTNVVGSLFTCVWCMSFWVGAVASTIYLVYPEFARNLSFVFALSTVAVIIQSFVERSE